MKNLYTQKELEKFHTQGKTEILAFRKVYSIKHSSNVGFYLLENERLKKFGGLPYTKRGSHIVTDLEYAKRIIYS